MNKPMFLNGKFLNLNHIPINSVEVKNMIYIKVCLFYLIFTQCSSSSSQLLYPILQKKETEEEKNKREEVQHLCLHFNNKNA
ncbi:hypothetical protein V1477_011421 [Vespula maculifrons]|uniref:Uncharacterized protein n=1 Tax=Vespula maculifrons TaxID=7453 RepID=A0ABD2BZ46_VESMC